MMSLAEQLRKEPDEWNELKSRVEVELSGLKEQAESEVSDIQLLQPELEEIANTTGPALQESIENAAGELRNEFQSALNSVSYSIQRLKSAAETMEDIFSNRLPNTMETTKARLVATYESAKQFVEEDFIEDVIEDAESQLDETKEKVESAVEELQGGFGDFVESTREQVSDLLNKLENFGSQWTEKIEGTKREYEQIVSRVKETGEAVKTLMEVADDALATSGVAMNAASSVLVEVKNVLDSVV